MRGPVTQRPIAVTIATGQLGLGGGERQLYLALRELDRGKFKPAVVTFNPGCGDHWETPIRELGVPLYEVAQSHNKLRRMSEFARLLRQTRARVVHGWDFPLNAAAALCGRLAGVPIRIGGLRRNLYKPGRTRWQRFVGTTGLDRFVVNSSRGRDDLVRYGASGDRIDLVTNAVEPPKTTMDDAARRAVRRRFGVEDDGELVIANISNLIAVKNHELLLDLTGRLLARGHRVRTAVFGDGPRREELLRRSEDPALAGRIVWMGRDPEAPTLIAAADLFCFTSRSEGCANVLLEAGSVGLPVVTTDVGGARDIVLDGETGYVVPSEDAAALVAAVERLVGDAELRKRFGAAARARVLSEFTARRTADALGAVYERSQVAWARP